MKHFKNALTDLPFFAILSIFVVIAYLNLTALF